MFSTTGPVLVQGPMWHLLSMSAQSSLTHGNLSTILVFHDFDTFKECWTLMSKNVAHFGMCLMYSHDYNEGTHFRQASEMALRPSWCILSGDS